MSRHNTTRSTERHWIPGQEGKSINRGEVNSTHACLAGAQTVAMDIREGWPHFLELVFHPWIFPRKSELISFVWLFIDFLFWVSSERGADSSPGFRNISLDFTCSLMQISQPFTTDLQLRHVPGISSAFYFLMTWKTSVIGRPPWVISG